MPIPAFAPVLRPEGSCAAGSADVVEMFVGPVVGVVVVEVGVAELNTEGVPADGLGVAAEMRVEEVEVKLASSSPKSAKRVSASGREQQLVSS